MDIVTLARSYIEPVAMQLKASGAVREDWRIRQALVLLPHDAPPEVLFNEGIGWIMRMDTSAMAPGQIAYLHDIKRVTGIGFPRHNGKKVAYIFMYYTGVAAKFSLCFDFSPNSQREEDIPEFGHGNDETLTAYYNIVFAEMALKTVPPNQLEAFRVSDFFVAPAIMPDPFVVLCNPTKSISDFASAMQRHFNANSLREMVDCWTAWGNRRSAFLEAVDNLRDSRYHSVIAVLTPQLEGVLRDAVFSLKNDDSRMNAEKAYKILHDEIEAGELSSLAKSFGFLQRVLQFRERTL